MCCGPVGSPSAGSHAGQRKDIVACLDQPDRAEAPRKRVAAAAGTLESPDNSLGETICSLLDVEHKGNIGQAITPAQIAPCSHWGAEHSRCRRNQCSTYGALLSPRGQTSPRRADRGTAQADAQLSSKSSSNDLSTSAHAILSRGAASTDT